MFINYKEYRMKIFTTNSTRFSGRCARFFGAMVMAVSMAVPAAIAVSPATVNLGSAANFVVLAGATVTNVASVGTIVNGDIGSGPGTAVTGFPPGLVTGTIHAGDSVADAAELDLTTAYNDAAGRVTPAPVTVAGNIGGQTLAPGLYKSTSSLEISSGDLTLDAGGDSSAVWIFQMASTLTTTEGRMVILTNSAQAGNIFWQVGSSATIGTNSVFYGTIMADQSITLVTGATLNGRALARIGAVTLDSNNVTKPEEKTTAVENESAPTVFSLSQNFPNPFNPSTTIQYSLVKAGMVSLKVYNVVGQEVVTLVNARQEAGRYALTFNADSGKTSLSNGVYFYRLEAGSFFSMKKFVFMK
jgi:hypothetical protein